MMGNTMATIWAGLVFLSLCVLLIHADLCEEDRNEPIDGDCSRYRSCSRGQWRDISCFDQVYHPRLAKCVNSDEYPCNDESHCYPEGGTRPNEECIRYDVCRNGIWVTYRCSDGYAYDYVTSTCIKKENATCYRCDQDYPDTNDCKEYYTCIGTRKVKKSCGLLKTFDGVTGKCVWFGAHCQPGSACREEGAKYSTSNCKQYEQCIAGRLYKRFCGFSQTFDSIKKKCVWAWPWHACEQDLNTPCTNDEIRVLGCRLYSKCISGVWHQQECRQDETVKDGKCVEGSCLFNAQTCDEYIINGKQVLCNPGYYFDEIQSRCTPGFCSSKGNSANKSCKEGESHRVKGTCKNYTVCTDGLLDKKVCDHCQNFDDNKSKCMFVWDSPCDDGIPTTTTTTKTTVTSSPPTTITTSTTPFPLCIPDERRPDYESCRKYYECDKKHVWQHKSCYWLLLFEFDADSLQCKFLTAHCAKKV